jgi:hypothetical protein
MLKGFRSDFDCAEYLESQGVVTEKAPALVLDFHSFFDETNATDKRGASGGARLQEVAAPSPCRVALVGARALAFLRQRPRPGDIVGIVGVYIPPPTKGFELRFAVKPLPLLVNGFSATVLQSARNPLPAGGEVEESPPDANPTSLQYWEKIGSFFKESVSADLSSFAQILFRPFNEEEIKRARATVLSRLISEFPERGAFAEVRKGQDASGAVSPSPLDLDKRESFFQDNLTAIIPPLSQPLVATLSGLSGAEIEKASAVALAPLENGEPSLSARNDSVLAEETEKPQKPSGSKVPARSEATVKSKALIKRGVSTRPKNSVKPKAIDDPKPLGKIAASMKTKESARPKASAKAKPLEKGETSAKPKESARPKASAKAKPLEKGEASAKPKEPARPKARAKAKPLEKGETSAKPKESARPKASAKAKPLEKGETSAQPKEPARPKASAKAKPLEKGEASASPKPIGAPKGADKPQAPARPRENRKEAATPPPLAPAQAEPRVAAREGETPLTHPSPEGGKSGGALGARERGLNAQASPNSALNRAPGAARAPRRSAVASFSAKKGKAAAPARRRHRALSLARPHKSRPLNGRGGKPRTNNG